jgi:hypothetical protein
MKALLLALTLALSGCVGTYRASVAVSTPDLVYVAPGVQVIPAYGESIFYADGFYWWYLDGAWYRSTYYTGGWVWVAAPPVVIARIGEPWRYRYHRPRGYVVRRPPVAPNRIQRPVVVRDHRDHRDRRDRRR